MMRRAQVLLVLSLGLILAGGLAAQNSNNVSPQQLNFVAVVNGSNPAAQTITVTPLAITPNWTAMIMNGSPWLSISTTSGNGAGTISVTAAAGSLAAGTYTDQVVVSFTNTNDVFHVSVQFNVAPSQVSFTGNVGGSNPANQTLQVAIAAGGSFGTNWSATVTTSSGGSWLTVAPANATSPPGSSQTLTVSANIKGLALGTYNGQITLNNATFGSSTATVTPVALTISTPALTLAPTSLTFNGSFGGTLTPQTVAVTTASGWTGSVTTASGGNWLSITPTSGTGNGTFSVNVNLASLSAITYNGSITVTPASGTPVSMSVTVNVAGPAISVTPQTLSFTQVEGQVAQAQTVSLSATPAVSNWSATTAVNATTIQWLSVAPGAGGFPSAPSIGPNSQAANLTAGTYTGTVTFADTNATPASLTVGVTLTVTPAPPTSMTVNQTVVNVQGTQTSGAPPVSVIIGNSGGGTVNWTASSTVSNPNVAGNWLTVSPTSGGATLHAPTPVQLSFASNLPPNVYTGTVTVASGTQTQTIAVQYIVTLSAPQLSLGQSALRFNMVAGGPVPQSQVVELANSGTAAMSYTVRVLTGSILGGLPSTAASLAAGGSGSFQVPIAASASSLTAGNYYGLINLSYATPSNPSALIGSAYISVLLNVAAAAAPPTVTTYPRGVIISPSALTQTVSLSTSSAATGGVPLALAVTTSSGGNWLNATSSAPTLTPAATVTVSGIAAALPTTPGTYTGTVTAIYGDGTPSQDINVFLVIPKTSGTGVQSLRGTPAAGCTPAKLIMALRQLSSNFSSAVGWPQNIEAQLVDDCANPAASATVLASFSTGDVPLALANVGSGFYAATWNPSNANPATVTVTGIQAGFPPVTAVVPGSVGANATPPPSISTGGVVNAASFAKNAAVSPGGIISAFGTNLAVGNNPNGGFPLLTTLGGIKLSIGGIDMPLFFAGNGQVNAQVPSELPTNTQTAMVARAFNGTLETGDSVPVPVTLAATTPGIFTVNSAGSGQGVILNNPGLQVVDATHPAAAGDVLTIYCTSLGATTPVVATGAPAPGSPPATVNSTVTVAFGTLAPAAVQFAGLTPGFVGLYQVNVAVPAGLTPSSTTQVTLNQSGIISNTVTIATK